MAESYKITGWDEQYLCHILEDHNGKPHKIDIMASGMFTGINVKELIGKRVSIIFKFPFVELAAGIKIER